MSGLSHPLEGSYRTVLETCLDGFLLTAPDGAICDANPAACRILGRTRAELIGMSRQQLVDWSDPACHSALYEWLSSGSFAGQVRWLRPDGSSFPIDVTSSLFIGLDGREQAGIFFRPVAEPRPADPLPPGSLEALADAFRAIGDPIIVHDAGGRVVIANDAALDLLGCATIGQATGVPLEDLLRRYVLQDAEGWEFPVSRLPGFRALAGDWYPEATLRLRDRSGARERWIHLRANALPTREPGVRLVVSVGRDVTDCLEQERSRFRAEARRARLEGVILAARELSHRLNNSLTLAVGSLDMIQMQCPLPDDAQEWIERAQLGLESAVRDIRKFQRVSRVETKDTPAGPALDLDRSSEAI